MKVTIIRDRVSVLPDLQPPPLAGVGRPLRRWVVGLRLQDQLVVVAQLQQLLGGQLQTGLHLLREGTSRQAHEGGGRTCKR